MGIDEAIGSIETCRSIDDLKKALQRIVECYGFASFNFLDAGRPHLDEPYYFGTSGAAWEDEYRTQKLVHYDPCVARARRSNVPFTWGSVSIPNQPGPRKSGAIRTMEAARDHGFTEGYVIPYHFVDDLGRVYSSSSVFFWKSRTRRFQFLMSSKRHEMHLIMLYWVQRAIDIVGEQYRDKAHFIERTLSTGHTGVLTDRERDVLSWAARGKTVSDTADILVISEQTVETHVRNAMQRLGASNKTHAVAKAIYLGLIDV